MFFIVRRAALENLPQRLPSSIAGFSGWSLQAFWHEMNTAGECTADSCALLLFQDLHGNGGRLSLTESDYAWVARQLVKSADQHSQGRLVSVLEEGSMGTQWSDRIAAEASMDTDSPVYGVLSLCVAAHVAALMDADFAGGI